VRSDFWSGGLFKDLRQLGLFSEKTDIALSLSSDGVKVFKTRTAFQIWPIMLVRILPSLSYSEHAYV
jgi:hypothetical protein